VRFKGSPGRSPTRGRRSYLDAVFRAFQSDMMATGRRGVCAVRFHPSNILRIVPRRRQSARSRSFNPASIATAVTEAEHSHDYLQWPPLHIAVLGPGRGWRTPAVALNKPSTAPSSVLDSPSKPARPQPDIWPNDDCCARVALSARCRAALMRVTNDASNRLSATFALVGIDAVSTLMAPSGSMIYQLGLVTSHPPTGFTQQSGGYHAGTCCAAGF